MKEDGLKQKRGKLMKNSPCKGGTSDSKMDNLLKTCINVKKVNKIFKNDLFK